MWATIAAFVVLGFIVFVVPADGSWQGPLVVLMFVGILASVAYDHGRRRGRRE